MPEQISLGAAIAGLIMALVPGIVGLVYAVGAYVRAKTAEVQASIAARQASTAAVESVKTNAMLETHKSEATERNAKMMDTMAETKATIEEVKKATNGMKDELVRAAYEAGKAGRPMPQS